MAAPNNVTCPKCKVTYDAGTDATASKAAHDQACDPNFGK